MKGLYVYANPKEESVLTETNVIQNEESINS